MIDGFPEPGARVPGAPPLLAGAAEHDSSPGAAENDRSPLRPGLLNRSAIAALLGVGLAEVVHQLTQRHQSHRTRLEALS